MSLIYFHVILIGTSILFSFALGVWGIEHFLESKKILDLATGGGSFTAASALAIYLGRFIRKNFKRPSAR